MSTRGSSPAVPSTDSLASAAEGADAGVVPPLTAGSQTSVAGQESRSWFVGVAPEKRKKIWKLHTLRLWMNSVALLFIGLWVAAAWTMLQFPTWPVRIAGTFLIGACIHALAILMHEGIHGSYFRNPVLDRTTAFLLGAPAFFSETAYRVPHIVHHRFNRSERDPDEFSNVSRKRAVVSLAFYAWIVLGMPVYVVQVYVGALRRGSRRERLHVILETALLAVLYAGVIIWAASHKKLGLVVELWLVPACVAAIFGNVRGWAEHTMTVKGSPLTQSRTVTSNWFVSLFMCNLNYHLEHHLFPAMPWYNLPKLHALLADEYRAAGSSTYRSYLRFLWDAFRIGVHGVTPPAPHTTRFGR
jgi:fatty acid desaturase